MKEITRDEVWELRKKYYALYETLKDKLPSGDTFYGSHDHIVSMSKIDSECATYAKVLQDIDDLLGI